MLAHDQTTKTVAADAGRAHGDWLARPETALYTVSVASEYSASSNSSGVGMSMRLRPPCTHHTLLRSCRTINILLLIACHMDGLQPGLLFTTVRLGAELTANIRCD